MNLKTWIHSIIAAAVGGAATSVSAVLVAPTSFNFTSIGWENIGKVALAGAIIPVLALLKKSPLPDTSTSNKPVDGANTLNLNKQ